MGKKDIGLKLDSTGGSFSIINQADSDIHPLLQAAVTLLFFSQDTVLRREFDGIYHIVGQSNNNINNSLDMELAALSFELTDILKQEYPEVIKTEFEIFIDGYAINIILNIQTTEELISGIIYAV